METALFNGFKTSSIATTRNGGLDRHVGWSLRASADLLGEFGEDGESDLSWHDELAWRLGGGTAYTRINKDGNLEFSQPDVVDMGVSLASILPPEVTSYDLWLATADAQWKYRGLSVIVDYYWHTITQFRGANVPDLFDHGFNLQSGYFVIPRKLETIIRWSRIVGDSGSLGGERRSSEEAGGGLTWYFNGHQAKVTCVAIYMNSAP